jgi:hypothetical protein
VVWLLVRTRNDAMAGERLAKAGPHAVSGAPSRDENGGALGEEAEREHGTVSPVKFPDCRLKEGHEHDILFRWIEGGRRTEGERRDHSSPSSPPRACANPARGGGHRPRPRSSSEAGSSQRRRWLRGKAPCLSCSLPCYTTRHHPTTMRGRNAAPDDGDEGGARPLLPRSVRWGLGRDLYTRRKIYWGSCE